MAQYVQKGSSIDYINNGAAAIAAGDIVNLGARIGVASTDIAVGAVGSVAVSGVFSMPKAAGAVTVGAALYFDSESGNITATSGEKTVPAGWAVAPAAADAAEVLIKIG